MSRTTCLCSPPISSLALGLLVAATHLSNQTFLAVMAAAHDDDDGQTQHLRQQHRQLLQQQQQQQNSLDGYAFNCNGALVGFEGTDKMFCQDFFGQPYQCGSYQYDAVNSQLSGSLTTGTGPFATARMDVIDGIAVAFVTTQGLTCIAFSLDWRNYDTRQFSVKCPTQNAVRGASGEVLSYQDNFFHFGTTGNFDGRSRLEITTGRGNTIVRDRIGVYLWNPDTELIKVYLGPQKSIADSTTYVGRLTRNTGQLYVKGSVPEGPCNWYIEKLPALHAVSELPQSNHPIVAGGGNSSPP